MKMKLFPVLALLAALAGGANAQITTANGSKSDATLLKIHKINLLSKILPLALTKDQYNDLLLAVEGARQLEKAELEEEDKELASLDPDVSDALDAAMNKDKYPPDKLQGQIASRASHMRFSRAIAIAQATKKVYDAIAKSFNAGQLKAMAGTFDDKDIDINAKKGDIKDNIKIDFFISDVFLDPVAYPLMVTLSKTAGSGSDTDKGGTSGTSGG